MKHIKGMVTASGDVVLVLAGTDADVTNFVAATVRGAEALRRWGGMEHHAVELELFAEAAVATDALLPELPSELR